MIRIPTRSRQRHPVRVERRSRTPWGRLRRFFNDYWLVPVLVIYLQLLAALMTVSGDARGGLLDQNRTFLSGIPLMTRIVTHEFPYAAIGHAKELLHTYASRSNPVTPAEVAAHVEADKRAIYLALWASRQVTDTELGGVLAVGRDREPRLYPVPSSNGALLGTLRNMPPEQVIDRLLAPENAELLAALAMNADTVERVGKILASPIFAENVKQAAFESVIYALETASDARYLVLPVDFKATLGHMPGWNYAGIYHFHNQLLSPPSPTDVESSFRVRQFVFCLAKDGFDLHDIENGRAHVNHFEVLPEAWVTQPEWFPLGGASIRL